MLHIARNEFLINRLSGKFTLLSAKLYRLDIYENAHSELAIDLYLELLYAKINNRIKLAFTTIEEFSFYHHRSNYFYNIERFKFFMIDQLVYLSIDPYDESEDISKDDQNFILSKNVDGILFNWSHKIKRIPSLVAALI